MLTSLGPLLALVAAMPDGLVVVGEDGLIALANEQVEVLFGYRSAELLNQPIEMLLPERTRKIHPAHRAGYFLAPNTRTMGSGLELFGRRKDGSEFPVDISLSSLEADGQRWAIAIVRDITQRKSIENQFQSLTEFMPDAMLVVNGQGAITRVNAQTENLFGYDRKELIGQPIEVLVPKRIKAAHPAHRKKYQRDAKTRTMGSGLELFGLRKDGTEFPVDVSLSVIETENGSSTIAIVRDITERKRAEQIKSENLDLERRVEERTAELYEAKNEAERANNAKSEFLSRMSHELRTPLNAILGYAQLLDMQQGDRKVKDAAHAILKGGTHLLEMINEVLDHSRIESGHVDFSLEPVPLARTLSQAVELVQTLAEASNIGLSLVQIDREIHVQADRQRLLQVFINLLSNALKYNKPGGTVTVRGAAIDSERFHIYFEDTGKGISSEDQKTLFVPFQRYGDTTVEGTGLGLTLSERFVRLMGGKLLLQNSSPEGSTFCVELGVTSLTDNMIESQADEEAIDMLARGARGVILYIEDNLSNLKLMESVLENIPGVRLISATNGDDGLELAFKMRPDLVLLDIHLPGMKAEDIFGSLRSDDRTSFVPVVVLSADATDRQIKRFKDLGVDEYLTKPLQLRKFLDVLDEHLLQKKDLEAYMARTNLPNAVV